MSKKLVRTVCVKLDVGTHADALAVTMRCFNEAATWIAQVCWSERISNTNTAHHRVYGETRARFGLGSQLAVCARAKAVEAIKAGKQRMKETCTTFGPRGAVRYDARTFRLLSLDRVSLSTMGPRVVCRMLPGARQHTMLVDPAWTIGGADLVWTDGTYFLHITQNREAPATTDGGGVLGVDLGLVQIATDSDGQTFSGGKVRGMRAYHVRRRQLVQPIKTRSSRKKLRRTKRRESRFQKDTNHCISKALVAKAATSCKALSLEELTGIRERITVRHEVRYQHSSWAFSTTQALYQLQGAGGGCPGCAGRPPQHEPDVQRLWALRASQSTRASLLSLPLLWVCRQRRCERCCDYRAAGRSQSAHGSAQRHWGAREGTSRLPVGGGC